MLTLLLTLAACQPEDGKPSDTDGNPTADADGDGLAGDDDCDDADPDVGEPTLLVYDDADEDGYGDNATFRTACAPGAGETELGDDCDDADPSIHPDATELCDGIDQDCDDTLDDGATTSYYADTDGDGFGDGRQLTQACAPPDGWVIDSTDCDDTSGTIHPGADEYCDGVDQDCDTEIDEDAVDPATWHTDADGDGYGDPDAIVLACSPPSGVAGDGSDCDDASPVVNPGAEEVCGDSLDEDCDGEANACGFSGTYDLGADDYTISGAAAEYLRMGDQVVTLGDVDGDGRDDFAVSSYTSDFYAGRTWIVHAADLADDDVYTVATASWIGETNFTNTGRFLASVGDITGDGVGDLLVGSDSASTAWLVSGTSSGTNYLSAAAVTIAGATDWLGASVSGAGDVDGDGNLDFLVGAPLSGTAHEGAVHLFRGPLAGGNLDPGDAYASFTGSITSEYVGYSVGGGHDLDGDGLADPVSGTYYGPTFTGAYWVVYDPAAGETALTDADVLLTGAAWDEHVGMDVVSVGDMNGDGYGELAIGAMGDASDAGAVYVMAGPPTSGDIATLAQVKYTGNAGSTLGDGLGELGDVDGDGLADLGMGAPLDNGGIGAAYVVYGPAGSGIVAITAADATFNGALSPGAAGTALAAGDVTGEGNVDLLVTAPLHTGGATYDGALHVILGE